MIETIPWIYEAVFSFAKFAWNEAIVSNHIHITSSLLFKLNFKRFLLTL